MCLRAVGRIIPCASNLAKPSLMLEICMTYLRIPSVSVGVMILAVWLAARPATAASLRLTQGEHSITTNDGDAADRNPTTGAVMHIGPVGTFAVTVSTGFTKPVLGTPELPWMDLNSIAVSHSPGTLVIEFTETGFTNSAVPAFLMQIGGSTGGTVAYATYLGLGNELFQKDVLLASTGELNGPAFSQSLSSSVGPDDSPYSLTQVVEITHGSGTKSTAFNASLQAVPEPGTFGLALMGLGAGAFVFWMRRGNKTLQA